MDLLPAEGPKRLRLRYPAVCSLCGRPIAAGTFAYWDKAEKRAACVGCVGEPTQGRVRLGEPGGSAQARAQALQLHAVARAQRKWGSRAAAVAAKVAAEDPDVRAWNKGGDGETRLGKYLEREVGDLAIVLHDRLIPGAKKANIDHVVVCPNGVWIVDAKTYAGEVRRVEAGSVFHPQNHLYIGRRNQTKLADGLARQVTAVRAALETDAELPAVLIYPALCFVDTGWPLLLRPFDVRGHVTVIHPKALRDRIRKRGSLDGGTIAGIAYVLASGLPPASG